MVFGWARENGRGPRTGLKNINSLLACKFGFYCSCSDSNLIFLEYKISTSIPLTAQRPEPFRRIRIQKFNPPPISLYLNFQRAQRPRRAFTYTRYRCLEFFPCIIFHFFIPSSPRPWHAGHCNRPTGVSNALSYYPKSAAKRRLRAASRLRTGWIIWINAVGLPSV